MTKAQKIRNNRSASINNDIKIKAADVFSWILDKFQEKIDKHDYGNIRVYKYKNDDEIKINESGEDTYNKGLEFFFIYHNEIKFFKELHNLFEKEEGFNAYLNLDDNIWDSPAISLTINID